MTEGIINKRIAVLFCAALLVALAFAAPARAYAATSSGLTAGTAKVQTQSAPTYNVFGVDVSQWQGVIDWKTASGKARFAVIRCGWGGDYSNQDDKQWLNNVKGCQNYNVPFGVYLYSYATNTNMAASEARHVIRCLKAAGLTPEKVSLPIYLDMEDKTTANLKPSEYAAIFNAFATTMRQAGYTKVGIYSSASWWDDKLNTIVLSPEYRWVAHWDVKAPGLSKSGTIAYPKTYSANSALWQYGSATVSGIKGEVDGNYAQPGWSCLTETEARQNVFRLYNPRSGEHLYTTDTNERDVLTARYEWKYEGVAWGAPRKNGVPVYRLYNPRSGEHLYTKDTNEVKVLSSRYGWRQEGLAWYGVTSGVPMYRLYNPRMSVGAHHLTSDAHERDVLVRSYGWRYEGIAMYTPS